MRTYVATFHTELSALITEKSLKRAGVPARLAPVPRALSSSCGFSVIYDSISPNEALMDEDAQGIYEQTGGGYSLVWEQDARP